MIESGEAASGGCNNPCGVDEEEIWTECRSYLMELYKYFAVWDQDIPNEQLETMRQEALSLAAGFERMQIARTRNV